MKKTSVHRPEHVVLVGVLRELRIQAGLTQASVAEQLGVAQTTISDIEINERGPDLFVIRDLCKVYGVTLEEVLTEVDKRLLDGQVKAPARIKRKDRKRL
jgi:transcriptional regulator with XRE-family HTH domain